jgi:hypothetical protein
MNIWKKSTQLEIACKNTKSEDTLILYYNVLDIDIADRWLALIEENKVRKNSLRYNYRKILSLSEIEDTFFEFRNNVSFINKNYDVNDDFLSLEMFGFHKVQEINSYFQYKMVSDSFEYYKVDKLAESSEKELEILQNLDLLRNLDLLHSLDLLQNLDLLHSLDLVHSLDLLHSLDMLGVNKVTESHVMDADNHYYYKEELDYILDYNRHSYN